MFDPRIRELIDELDHLAKSRDDAWQIPRAEGELLHHIALSMDAKTIVEVGTSYGFSGLFWAAAMRRTGGHLHTIDKDPKKYESSRQTFARAGVDDLVTNYLGDAQGVIKNMPSDLPIDLAFIDANKSATAAYFELLWPRVRPGGAVLIDNATTHATEMRETFEQIRARRDVACSTIALGNGIEWIIKTSSS